MRQRLTVVVTDALLMAAAAYALDTASSGLLRRRSQLAFALVAGHAGLLLVDHIHFQYNGMLLGGSLSRLSWPGCCWWTASICNTIACC